MREHRYSIALTWTGNKGEGTRSYTSYDRSHSISIEGKPSLLCSSDPSFRGDNGKHNPEELLVSSLSSCHMLWFLHICVINDIVVTKYEDAAVGMMKENADGSGQFIEVILRPQVTITDASRLGEIEALHHKAHDMCFVARSVNFPVRVDGKTVSESQG